jgi:SAM-dependent methyltransferase
MNDNSSYVYRNGPFANAEDVSGVSNEGERYVPLAIPYNAAMHLGHMASYKHALRYAYGKNVLDLGCGTGYGAHFLASFGASSVLAADFDQTAVDYAVKYYAHPNVKHLRLDGNRPLPFNDSSFDFVFCSQVIEHIVEPGELLNEIRRVLKPGGFCLVTAPNKELFTPDPQHHQNEHHISEMNASQYESLGRTVFPRVRLAGIPQNCLVLNPDQSVSVKTNEEIAPGDYRMVFDAVSTCENLLLFGHTREDGEFDETLPDKLAPVSSGLEPCFWDAAPGVERWVTLGSYPRTPAPGERPGRSPALGVLKTTVYSPYDKLYRIEISLLNDGEYEIDAVLREGSSKGAVMLKTAARVHNRRASLLFPPLAGSGQRYYHLELRARCRFWHYLSKRESIPRFACQGGQPVVHTFHG